MDKRANILIVDDHPENLLAMEAVLRDLGQNLVTASCGAEALRYLLVQDFALVLLDVMMPDMDGFEVAELIRQRDTSRHTPIIFLTGLDGNEDYLRRGYELGAVDYLVKPFIPELLRWKASVFVDLYLKSQEVQHLGEINRLNLRLESALSRVQELYRISRDIGQAKSSIEIVNTLILSRMLRTASLGVIFVFDTPWEDAPPASGYIEAFWQLDPSIPNATGTRYSIQEYEMAKVFSRDEPVIVPDVESDKRIGSRLREVFVPLQSHGIVQFPLIASGLWFGSFAVHWTTDPPINDEDVRHLQGLIDQAAAAIYNLLLLRTESKARREAEKADELKLQFLAMVSHELRTPLTSIKGFLSTLLTEDVIWTGEQQRQFLRIAENEADNLTELVEQLLEMSRLEAGTMRLQQQSCHIEEIIADAMPQLDALCQYHDLKFHIPTGLPPIQVDSRRIIQVVTNLVENACKYSPDDTPIEIFAQTDKGFMQVSVRDYGQGIPLDERETVFHAFRQATNRPQREARGAGLGLAIAKRLIEAHGGTIWIEGQDAPGTTISFIVPHT